MNARYTIHALANKFYSGTHMTAEDVVNAREAIRSYNTSENIALYSLIKKQVDERAQKEADAIAENPSEIPESTD